jgi:hypothetical protein
LMERNWMVQRKMVEARGNVQGEELVMGKVGLIDRPGEFEEWR